MWCCHQNKCLACLLSFFVLFCFRLHFLWSACVFFFSPIFCSLQMAHAKTTENRTRELVEPATLFVQYRLRNVVKKSLRHPALFLPTLQSNPVHLTMFSDRATVHKRGRLRDQTAREMLSSEQSYAATLEEMVSVCCTNEPKQCTTVKMNTRQQHTFFGCFWNTAVRRPTESSSRHSIKNHFQEGYQHHLWECRGDHHNQPCFHRPSSTMRMCATTHLETKNRK